MTKLLAPRPRALSFHLWAPTGPSSHLSCLYLNVEAQNEFELAPFVRMACERGKVHHQEEKIYVCIKS